MKSKSASEKKSEQSWLNACRENDLATLHKLIELGPLPPHLERGATSPLLEVASRGFEEAVQLLLHAGVNVNAMSKHGETALAYAAGNGNVRIVERLLAAGADPNCILKAPAKFSALTIAAARGHLPIVKLLVKAGANIEGWNEPNKPLAEASGAKHFEIAQYLLKHGADPNGSGTLGVTPLIAFARSVDGIKLLLEHHADVNAVNANGMSALMCAARACNLEAVKLLLKNGADPMQKDTFRRHVGRQDNALTWAINSKCREVVAWLIKQGLAFEKHELDLARNLLAKKETKPTRSKETKPTRSLHS